MSSYVKPISAIRGPISMKRNHLRLQALTVAALLSSVSATAQSRPGIPSVSLAFASYSASAHEEGSSSSRTETSTVEPTAAAAGVTVSPQLPTTTHMRPFSKTGIAVRVGLGGVGFDVATPLSTRFNLRTGADFFSYSSSFQEQGANIIADLRLRSEHAALDWFPFGGRFRLSPQVVFPNNNRVAATAVIPSGSDISLNGSDYISSYTDPLHGSGSVDFRKIAPGISLGFGNIIPRSKSHFSIPVEAGFYYVGQPRLKVGFSGNGCDPSVPASIGCQAVSQDPGFHRNLAAFIARNT